MATMLSSLFFTTVIFGVLALPEQGVWVVNINKDHVRQAFSKTMYKDTQISVSIACQGDKDVDLVVSWMLRRSPCAGEFNGVDAGERARLYMGSNYPPIDRLPYSEIQYLQSLGKTVTCPKNGHAVLEPFEYKKPMVVEKPKPLQQAASTNKTSGATAAQTPKAAVSNAEGNNSEKGSTAVESKQRKKREAEPADVAKADESNKVQEEAKDQKVPETDKAAAGAKPSINPMEIGSDSSKLDHNTLVKVWDDGYYLFVISFETMPQESLNLEVTVRMSLEDNYISAGDKPLLIFYGVMGLVYVFYAIFWMVMLACNWRDLLRVQFWISAVIFLGMLEKAVFFGEYENVNKTGQSVHGAVIFAELVSCAKRTLARVLVIIVSLGYGIVKPRLGQAFHRVLIVGGIFFILASIEACLRAGADKAEQSKPQLIASVPLAVTEAIICWWIFNALLQTTRTLRLRRNVVKLSLYRHFTNTLIFSILASIAYMVWFLTQHRFTACITDWKELWMDDAFWHFLFSVILFIIMVLWRPSANNQRYAFSPLLDAAEDDVDDELALTEAYDGMKMRTTKTQQRNGSSVKDEQKLEDDLKWVEENIPSSIVDKVLPALDSDEEIMNTKFETSKME